MIVVRRRITVGNGVLDELWEELKEGCLEGRIGIGKRLGAVGDNGRGAIMKTQFRCTRTKRVFDSRVENFVAKDVVQGRENRRARGRAMTFAAVGKSPFPVVFQNFVSPEPTFVRAVRTYAATRWTGVVRGTHQIS